MAQSVILDSDHSWSHRWRQRLSRWLDRWSVPESAAIMFTALVVGIGTGFGAVIFRHLIETVQFTAYGGGWLTGIAPLHLLLVPALGGAIIGPLIYFLAPETRGAGVPEVMEAVALRGGRIRSRVIGLKALAASICIGTGGSVGREGPVVQIGAALGSLVGQVFKLSDERVRNLAACGAAGGIAATFNAPIAGSIFALEVIFGEFHVVYFGSVVISAVVAAVIAHVFEGDAPAFLIPEYSLLSPWELPLYTLLGVLAALGSVAFMRSLYFSEDVWNKIPLPIYVKPALGGLLLGLVGLLSFKIDGVPRIFGVGYETTTQVLFGQMAIRAAVILLVLKFLATSITLGSGGSGGVFAPLLFIGAMFGGVFGQVANYLFPAFTAPAGAYALVGMAAFVSGATRTPVTSILILFEMTGNYYIILPLMLATVMSALISRMISYYSIYTLKLKRRGVHIDQGRDIDVLQTVTVGEAMATEINKVSASLPLEALADEFDRTHQHGLPVVDEMNRLVGVVSIQDLERALAAGPAQGKTVIDIATTENLIVAYPPEKVGVALRRLGTRDLSLLPVVEHESARRLVGVIRRRNIVRAYNYALIKRAQQNHRAEMRRVEKSDEAGFVQIALDCGSPVVGKRVSEIMLPEESLIVSLRRGAKLQVVHGYTFLQAGDQVSIFADRRHFPSVYQTLTGKPYTQKAAATYQIRPLGRQRNGASLVSWGQESKRVVFD